MSGRLILGKRCLGKPTVSSGHSFQFFPPARVVTLVRFQAKARGHDVTTQFKAKNTATLASEGRKKANMNRNEISETQSETKSLLWGQRLPGYYTRSKNC